MKNLMLALLFTTVSSTAISGVKVIYGDDNREDVINSSSEYIELAKSTAALVPAENITFDAATGNFKLNLERKLSTPGMNGVGICKYERFSSQPTAAICSGFLIGKQTLVTAGHCIKDMMDCKSRKWVFDYKVERNGDVEAIKTKNQVYSCESIYVQKLENEGLDYAVIKLDRPVEGRKPLKFRSSGTVQKGDEILVIGHPTGLPTKVTDKGIVRNVNILGGFFQTNLDTYGGNSGSAVFNTTTGVVEGILVRGETDYIPDYDLRCMKSNRCDSNDCRGEDVTLMSAVYNAIKTKMNTARK